MGSSAALGEAPATAGVRPTPRFSRRSPGRAWLIGLAAIPLLIAVIGYGGLGRPTSVTEPKGALPTLTTTGSTPAAPGLALSLLSISRSGNTITVIGDFPDESAKAALMTALKRLLVPGVNVVDQMRIDPMVESLDFSEAEPVFAASEPIPDFRLGVEGDTVTLSGTAPTPERKDAVERAALGAWPQVNVENNIGIKGQAPPEPGPGSCADVQARIDEITGGPIGFGDDGVSLTPTDNQILTKVADTLQACSDASVTINGYTDNTGSEGINIPLSAQRAKTVADFLVAQGVDPERIATKGLGSINPIASNETAEGRIKNRRAEIVVS